MPVISFTLIFAASAFVVFLVSRLFDRRLSIWAGVLFAAYVGLDDLATGLPSMYPEFRIIDATWNWTGKIYSLALAALIFFGTKDQPRSSRTDAVAAKPSCFNDYARPVRAVGPRAGSHL